MIKKLSVFVFILSLLLIAYSTYKSSLISNDKAVYKYVDGNLIVDFVNPNSNAYYSGMHIGDKIVSVNGLQIFSRHVLHNMIFDRTHPYDTLSYVIEREGRRVQFSSVVERRFSMPDLIQFFFFGVLYSLFSMFFVNSYPASKTKYYLYAFFVCLSLLMTMFNVPFSHRVLYPMMMIISALLAIFLLLFTQHYLFEFKVKWPRIVLSAMVLSFFALWIVTYFIWTKTMTEHDYMHLIFFLRGFQLSFAIIAIYSIVSVFMKILRLYVNKQPKEYFIVTYVFLFVLVIYPLLYALPFVLRQKELVPFSVYFNIFLVLLMLSVFYRKKLSRVFL